MKTTSLLRFLLLILISCLTTHVAASITISSGSKYSISCEKYEGFVGLGSFHGAYASIYYQTNSTTTTSDGYWIIKKDGQGYTIQNAETKEYVSWTSDKDATKYKYMILSTEVTDAERWTFEDYNGKTIIRSLINSNYYWNVRTDGSYLVGGYNGRPYTDNSFFILKPVGDGGIQVDNTSDDEVHIGSQATEIDFNRYYIIYNGGHDSYLYAQDSKYEWSFASGAVGGVNFYYPIYAMPRNKVSIDGRKFSEISQYIVKFVKNSESSVYIQSVWNDEYYNKLQKSTNTGTTPNRDYPFEYGKIKGSDNWFWFYEPTSKLYMDCNNPADMYDMTATMAGWTEAPTEISSNSAWQLFEVSIGDKTPVESVTLDYTALKIPVGREFTITTTILPKDATNRNISWTSNSNNIASVFSGAVTAHRPGTAIIKATSLSSSGVSATCRIEVYDPSSGADTPQSTDTLFIFKKDGSMIAFPSSLIASQTENNDGSLTVNTIGGETYTYRQSEIETKSKSFRSHESTLPHLKSYKFNNKFNDQLQKDIEAPVNIEVADSIVPSTFDMYIPAAIGKRLTVSFKKSTSNSTLYLEGVRQESKETRNRMEGGVYHYVLAPDNYTVYSPDGKPEGNIYDISDPLNPIPLTHLSTEQRYAFLPYGREYTVSIQWATDKTTARYRVPTVYITTEDGKFINSKTVYKSATIRIDGAGVYEDMPETQVNIKGRGNSSWSTVSSSTATGYMTPKNPYRLKFDTKQKVLGMTKGKNWVLLANKQTGSMTTNAIAMKLAGMVGTVAANHIVPVDLYINDDYRGSYNMTEKVGFSNNSIDLADETNAILLQLDTYEDTWQFNDYYYNITTQVMEPDLEEEKSISFTHANKHNAAIKNCWNTFTRQVKNSSGYEDHMDIQAFVRTMLVIDLTRNQELKHPKSWYVYNENALNDLGDSQWEINTESPFVFGPVWDFDWAFGYDGTRQYFIYSADTDIFEDAVTNEYGTPHYGGDFFHAVRYNSDKVKKAYYSLWTKFMNSGKLDELIEYCNDYYEYAKESFTHDASLWGSSNYSNLTSLAQSWLRRRAEWIYSNLEAYDLSDEEEDIVKPDEDSGTGIQSTAGQTQDSNMIFNIQGQRSTRLSRGLNIINGRKIIVR